MTLQQKYEFQFQVKLDSYTPLVAELRHYFSDDEMERLRRSDRAGRHTKRTVVLLSFENRYASLGGLAAVLRYFPQELAQQGETTVLLTPFHAGSESVQRAVASGGLEAVFTHLACNVCGYTADVSCYRETDAGIPSYHVAIDGRFTAGNNPYGYADPQDLLVDALSFCAVVPQVMAKLDINDTLLFHAQDWETAPVALFCRYAILSGVLQNAKTVLTMHNSFDAPLSDELKQRYFGKMFPGCTVLQSMLPLLNGPLTTVSTPFAFELRNDPLQCSVFADHLQPFFKRNPPLGIENGMFGKPEFHFSPEEMAAAEAGDFALLLTRKEGWRHTFTEALSANDDPRVIGSINCSNDAPPPPMLFLAGRLDLMQKGFDIVFHALRDLPRGKVKLFFCPSLSREDDDLSFFRQIAEECQGDCTIWPFRLSAHHFRRFLMGSSFQLMPSLYEPFGSVSEGLLHGTPIIARATGGILAQISPQEGFIPPAGYGELCQSAQSGTSNGILFRETFPDAEAQTQWRELLGASPADRMKLPLYRAMVDAAKRALLQASDLYADQSNYAAMILHGLHSVADYTWEAAVKKYRAVYDVAQMVG